MSKKIVVFMFALMVAVAAHAQTKPAPADRAQAKSDVVAAKAEAAAAKSAPEAPGLPVNVKIEVSITDQTGASPAAKKVVTMIASDRNQNFIRSSASVPVPMRMGPGPITATTQYTYRNVTINVDAKPTIVMKEPSKVHLVLGLEYLPKTAANQEEMEPGMAQLSERLALILESGKPMIVSQAADPASDRKITVEVTATILK